jgi:hypothetical protein
MNKENQIRGMLGRGELRQINDQIYINKNPCSFVSSNMPPPNPLDIVCEKSVKWGIKPAMIRPKSRAQAFEVPRAF